VAANALELARHGQPKKPFYLTGQVGGRPFSVHAEGERVILTKAAGERQEIDLVPPAAENATDAEALPEPVCPAGVVASQDVETEEPAADGLPGTSPLDRGLDDVRAAFSAPEGGEA
jgi:hypothetical protein